MKGAVPYVPFKTFLAAIEGFERGLPAQLDRSLWPSYSGAIQGQLLGAFRFFGLLDEANCVTPELKELVNRREQRRQILRSLVEKGFADLLAMDLVRTTPRQLDEAMRRYGLTGATHKKAMSFFLQAATFAGIPLSALLKGRTRTNAPRRPEAPARKAEREAASALPPGSHVAKTVQLRSGGTITISASVDLFQLDAADRAFVFALIDKLRGYEEGA